MPPAWRAFFGPYAYQPNFWPLRALFNASSIWIFGSIGCALVLLVYNLFRRIILLFSDGGATGPDERRRDFLKKSVTAAATVPFLVSGYGVMLGRERFQVDHFEIPVSGLSSALSHLTVVQLTDLHVGPFMTGDEVAEHVEAVNRLKPDLIALTGDFVSGSPSEVAPCVEALAGLRARYGVFACMGNHDIYSGADDLLSRRLGEKRIRTLRNEASVIEIGNGRLTLLGIDDLRGGKPDLLRAIRSTEREAGEVKILLSHRPEIFPIAAGRGIDLVLSGHYHGGQVKLGRDPASLSIARLMTPYAEGLFRLRRPARSAGAERRESALFVSRGIGITALPIRVSCPPQIAHLRLIKA